MIGLFLQVGGIGFQNILQQLEDLGFFKHILPFLLIFAVVYAILKQIPTFKENTGAAAIIAVAIGLLSLQLDFVPAFFQNFFPKVGAGIAILVVALILAGAFIVDLEKKDTYKWIFFGVGVVILIITLILSFSNLQFTGSFWWQQYGALVIVAIVVIVAMILVMVASNKGTKAS